MKKIYTVTDQIITKITGWIAAIVIICLCIWGIQTLYGYYKYEQTNDAQVQEYVNPVISRAGGFIVAVKFEENEYVHKGDTLLVIDNREYDLQQRQTEALLQKELAQLDVLESNTRTLEKSADAANAQISANKAKVWKQQLDFDRYKKLFEEESATRQQLENMEAMLQVNKGDYLSSEETYKAATSRITDIKAEKVVVKADILRLKALLERHKLDVTYTVLTAPYNGRMGRRTVEVGQMIDAGAVLAFIVDNETDKWVVANYKETQIEHMQIGDSVEVIADAYPSEKFKGTIISLSPATGSSFSLLPPDNSTGNYVKIVQRVPVRIKLTGNTKETDRLRVGMNVNVFFPRRNNG